MAVVNDIQKLEGEGYTVEQAVEIVKAKELRDIKKVGEEIARVLTCSSVDISMLREELVNFFDVIIDTPEEQRERALKEMLDRLFSK